MTPVERCDACHTIVTTTTCLRCRSRFCPPCEGLHIQFARHRFVSVKLRRLHPEPRSHRQAL
ncbi:MAG TPA: hypothetical protein VLE71_01555 [Actinomycetota bacterium]|nr:hypothetical protein [Actinomycetota bacterium]